MAQATLSLLGLYNFDNTILDSLVIPSAIDKQTLIDNLLMETAEFEVLYPNFDFFKFAIGAWSRKELPIWEKLYETTQYEYNAIHNYDRTETSTDSENRNFVNDSNGFSSVNGTNDETRNLNGSNNEIRNLDIDNLQTFNKKATDKETRKLHFDSGETRNLSTDTKHDSDTSGTVENSGKDTTTEGVSAFNQSAFTNAKQVENELGSKNKSTGKIKYTTDVIDTGTVDTDSNEEGTIDNSKTDTGTIDSKTSDTGTINRSVTDSGTIKYTKSDNVTLNNNTTDIGTIDRTHTMHAEGNIGVTTTQQMIQAEREVVKFSVMNYIIDSFKGRFCILIY